MSMTIRGIDPARLDRMRTAGHDGHGNPWRPYPRPVEGSPLRCCLRLARAGEKVVVIGYAPADAASPYRTVGPVFVHHDPCDGYATPDRYPPEFRGREQIFRGYDGRGWLDYDQIRRVGGDGDPERELAELLDVPGVAFVHTFNPMAGCFMLEARRG